MSVSASDWSKGIAFSITASVIGGASKLAIRKSWKMIEGLPDPSGHHTEASSYKRPNNDDSESRNNGGFPSDSNVTVDTVMIADCRNLLHRGTHHRSFFLRFAGMIGMTVLNPLCCVLAMKYASPSILAPFSGLTLVWIILFSEIAVGERPSRIQVLAAGLIILGEVIVAISGDHTNDEGVRMDDVMDSYKEPAFILFLFLLFLWMIALCFMIRFCNEAIRRLAWGVIGGSVTGLQNFLKDSLTLAKTTSPPPLFFYVFALGAIASSFSGLMGLTACMKRYDATYSSSMFVGSFVISASIMSAAHYHTFANLERTWNFICYPFGLLVLLSGIVILARECPKQVQTGVAGARSEEARTPHRLDLQLKDISDLSIERSDITVPLIDGSE